MTSNNDFIKSEMLAFEEYLSTRFPRKNKFSDEVSKAIFASGGKRLRPYFTFLFAQIGNKYNREITFKTAAAIEMLHTATLVHDDIIDNAHTRRNKPTVNSEYGTHMAVYTGDYLLLKAMKELVSLDTYDSEKVNKILNTLTDICTGEIDQYFSKNEITSVFGYFKRIRKKTALLFGAACGLGAYDAGLADEDINKAFKFGVEFGMAFQIKDDIDNFVGNDKEGKPKKNDLIDGIITLPMLIIATKNNLFKYKLETFLTDKKHTDELIKDMISEGGISQSEIIMNKYIIRAKKNA